MQYHGQTHVWTEESMSDYLRLFNTYGTEKLVFECVHFLSLFTDLIYL